MVTATSASAADEYHVLCSNGTYSSFLAWDFGTIRSRVVPAGMCDWFAWPEGKTAFIWGEYSPGNNFLIGADDKRGDISTMGNMGNPSFTKLTHG